MSPTPLFRPILLEPILVERPWGDQRLARHLGKALPPGARIGESWETANEARVADGPLAGLTLRELVTRFGPALLGARGLAASQPFGDFPLLVKFIDADDVLSVQVHPDDEQAQPLGQRGKTEAWYILAAEPGAELIVGLTAPLDPSTVRTLLAERRLAEYLVRLPVQAGDTVIVPAGTLHAIGRGILLYEIQEQSDITYRFYDWDRVDAAGHGRPLHIEEGLVVLRPERQARRTQPLALDEWRTILTACRYFLLERWVVSGTRQLPVAAEQTFRILSCIAGQVTLGTAGPNGFPSRPVRPRSCQPRCSRSNSLVTVPSWSRACPISPPTSSRHSARVATTRPRSGNLPVLPAISIRSSSGQLTDDESAALPRPGHCLDVSNSAEHTACSTKEDMTLYRRGQRISRRQPRARSVRRFRTEGWIR